MTDSRFRGLLEGLATCGGTDLHLVPGEPPRVRVRNDLITLDDQVLSTAEIGAWTRQLAAVKPGTGSVVDIFVKHGDRRFRAVALDGYITVRAIETPQPKATGAGAAATRTAARTDTHTPSPTSAPTAAADATTHTAVDVADLVGTHAHAEAAAGPFLDALSYFGPVIAGTPHARGVVKILARAEQVAAENVRRILDGGDPHTLAKADQIHARLRDLRTRALAALDLLASDHTAADSTDPSTDPSTGAQSSGSKTHDGIEHLDFTTPRSFE